jgi:hypothetical protein
VIIVGYLFVKLDYHQINSGPAAFITTMSADPGSTKQAQQVNGQYQACAANQSIAKLSYQGKECP